MPEHVDTILCEVLRQEANNKISLLGVYGEWILVPKIPTRLPTLAFAQRWRPGPGEKEGDTFRCELELSGPGLTPIRVEAQPLVIGPGPRPQMLIAFQMQAFPLPEEGEYQIRTFMDGLERRAHKFFVSQATKEDVERLKLVGFEEPSPV